MANNTPFPDWLYEILQAPYEARQQAGKVVTQGPVDWGGMQNDLYDYLNGPRQERINSGKYTTSNGGLVDWGAIASDYGYGNASQQQMPTTKATTVSSTTTAQQQPVGNGYGWVTNKDQSRQQQGQKQAIAYNTTPKATTYDSPSVVLVGTDPTDPTEGMAWEPATTAKAKSNAMTNSELAYAATGDPWAGRRNPAENAAMRVASTQPTQQQQSRGAQLLDMLASLLPSAATPNIAKSGSGRTFNGHSFWSGNTAGATYNQDTGWTVASKRTPNTGSFTGSSSGGSLVGSSEKYQSGADYVAAAEKAGASAELVASLKRAYGL